MSTTSGSHDRATLVYEGPLVRFLTDADDERAMEAAFLAAVTGSGRLSDRGTRMSTVSVPQTREGNRVGKR